MVSMVPGLEGCEVRVNVSHHELDNTPSLTIVLLANISCREEALS